MFLIERLVLLQGGVQSGSGKQGSGNVEQTAKQWLTGGQKWLKSAGKKLANAAKESASELQKRLETVDVKMQKGSLASSLSVHYNLEVSLQCELRCPDLTAAERQHRHIVAFCSSRDVYARRNQKREAHAYPKLPFGLAKPILQFLHAFWHLVPLHRLPARKAQLQRSRSSRVENSVERYVLHHCNAVSIAALSQKATSYGTIEWMD